MGMKTCPYCQIQFKPKKFAQVCCHNYKCALAHVRSKRQRAVEKAKRKSNREAKAKIKRLSEWHAEAQTQCNKYIRERDKDKDLPCISCGRYDWEIEDKWTGGKWDAGHFVSRGAEPALRYHFLNINKQCKSCNSGSGRHAKKRHTVSQEYEQRLIERIGQDMVDWLKGPHKMQNLRKDDVIEIKAYFKEQIKLLKDRS